MTSRPSPAPRREPLLQRRVLAGFTLLEVMLALSILAITLVGLLGRTTGNVRLTQEVAMRGTAANLARGKMYEIEDELLREGFQELDQTLEGDFSEEGWRDIEWEAVIEKVELPSMGSLDALQGQGEAGDTATEEEGAGGGILGQMLSMGGGPAGTGTEDGSMDAAFISSQFEMLREVLEVSIRKVTLTVTWKVGSEDQELVVACYFTDPAALEQVLPGLGGGGLPGGGAPGAGGDSGRGSDSAGGGSSGRGSGSGSGRGSGGGRGGGGRGGGR